MINKIYTLKNRIGSGYGSINDGPILWTGDAVNAQVAAAMASKELNGIWVNPIDLDEHDDPYYSEEAKRYRQRIKS